MNNKKTVSQILVFIVLLVIVIGGILVKINIDDNNTQNNNSEYANLNINQEELNIFYLNVGQADSTFITINGYNMLIDSGNEQDGYYIWQFLKAQNITKLDYFIITHFDEDHMGGAYKILEEMKIGVLYMPNNSSDTKTYQKFIQTIEQENINVNRNLKASNDIIYSLGNATWKVLNIDDGKNLNDSSIVIQLDYKQTKYLFMGDATSNVEENSDIKWEEIDVLKVGHHGDSKCTSQNFLNKINPKYAIISVGKNNSYKHPDEETLERLQNHSSILQIYRTDEDGTIWLTSSGNEINIEKIKYNLDGTGRKQAIFFERKYLYAFFLHYRFSVFKPNYMV